MKANQKGYSVVEIVIVIVVVGLLGAVGWLVYDRQNNKKSAAASNAQTDTQNSNKETEKPAESNKPQVKTYTDSSLGHSFEYPSDWQLSVKEDKGYFDQKAKTLTTYNIVTVKSPDAKLKQEEGPGGFGVLEGAAFIVYATPKTGEAGPNFNATVDGNQAVEHEYNPSPHVEYFTGTYFRKGALDYSVTYWYPKDGKSKYTTQYQALLTSFKTNK